LPALSKPDNSLCELTLRDLLAKCDRTAGQHRQNAQRWQRHAAVHQVPGGHRESLEKCLAKAERESRLSRVWQAYAEALRGVLGGAESEI
jgi:hypothetical protein